MSSVRARKHILREKLSFQEEKQCVIDAIARLVSIAVCQVRFMAGDTAYTITSEMTGDLIANDIRHRLNQCGYSTTQLALLKRIYNEWLAERQVPLIVQELVGEVELKPTCNFLTNKGINLSGLCAIYYQALNINPKNCVLGDVRPAPHSGSAGAISMMEAAELKGDVKKRTKEVMLEFYTMLAKFATGHLLEQLQRESTSHSSPATLTLRTRYKDLFTTLQGDTKTYFAYIQRLDVIVQENQPKKDQAAASVESRIVLQAEVFERISEKEEKLPLSRFTKVARY